MYSSKLIIISLLLILWCSGICCRGRLDTCSTLPPTEISIQGLSPLFLFFKWSNSCFTHRRAHPILVPTSQALPSKDSFLMTLCYDAFWLEWENSDPALINSLLSLNQNRFAHSPTRCKSKRLRKFLRNNWFFCCFSLCFFSRCQHSWCHVRCQFRFSKA